jgi:putative ABC transport system permease protein
MKEKPTTRERRRRIPSLWRGMILLIGVLVPRALRADWRREWEAELQHRERVLADWDHLTPRHKLGLFGQSCGALLDALWLQPSRLEDEMFQDLRFGARMLLKNKLFTLVAVITLSLGIGANTAIFSVVNAVLLSPLPFKDSERLVMVWNRNVEAAGGDRTPLAVADLLDWRAQGKSFAEIAAYQTMTSNYTGGETPLRISHARVTVNLLTTLGVQTQTGRSFSADEERPGGPRVALLGDRFWKNQFASDPGVVGRAITLNGFSYTIVGVLPKALNFPDKAVEVWTALQLETPSRRGPYFLNGVSRLKPGVTPQQARTETQAILSSFDKGGFKFNILPINDFIVGDVRLALWVLLGAVIMVLLIAAVNVANLMLVRSAGRSREMSIRAALGAGRARIIRQLLTESLLLAFAGGALGVLWAWVGVRLLLSVAPADLPRLDQIGVDGRVLGWTALLSLLTGMIFGLAPAWQSSRLNLNETLKEGGRSSTDGAAKRRGRDLLVVAELALAVALLIGAGLLVKSFRRLQAVDIGADAERVLNMSIALRGERYNDAGKVEAFYSQLLEKVKALPGVRAAALSNGLPPDRKDYSDDFMIEGQTYSSDRPAPIAYYLRVSPDYFRTLNIPLRSGRNFDETMARNTPQVIILNESTAKQLFPNIDPIGKRINTGTPELQNWWEIIGVVGDVKYTGVAEKTQPTLYMSTRQGSPRDLFLSLKCETRDALSLGSALRAEIRRLDPELPAAEIETLEQQLALTLAQPRFRTALIGVFAALALTLAVIGVYGVISYSVAHRSHEIGVRLALGAGSRQILILVLREGAALAAVGAGLGVVGAFLLTRFLNNLLFQVSATDAQIFIAVPLALIAAAQAAAYLPARRATKVDPIIALRSE